MKKVTIKREEKKIREQKTSKTPSVWSITAYCTKFGYILSEWHGSLSLRKVKAEHQVSCLCFFFFFYNVCCFSIFVGCAVVCGPPPSSFLGGLGDVGWGRGRSGRGGALVSVGVGVCAGRGVVDPVQDDEAHAADHDQEAAHQEQGGLEGRTGSNVSRQSKNALSGDASGILPVL